MPIRLKLAAAQLRSAVADADDPGLRQYLELRARALETERLLRQRSGVARHEAQRGSTSSSARSRTYTDKLFGYKAAAESVRP